MKINEIINEAATPGTWDTLKTVGAGIKGAVQGIGQGGMKAGALAGMASQQAKAAQTKMVSTVSNQALGQWSKIAQAMQTAGQAPSAEAATKWFTKFSGVNPSTPPPGDNPAQIQQWLQKEISGYIANKALAQADMQPQAPGAPAQGGTATPEPQPGQPMTPQQAQAEKTSKVGTGQINKIIPTLRTRDLQSVKKTVDATLATKAKAPAQPTAAAPAANANQGTVTQTPTGVANKANPANPNQAFAQPGSTQIKPTAV